MIYPNIEIERIKHQLSRDDLASMLHVTRRTIQNWQNGKTEIPTHKVILLSRTWEVSTDYLLSLDTGQGVHEEV